MLLLVLLISSGVLFAQKKNGAISFTKQDTETLRARDIVESINGSKSTGDITFGTESVFSSERIYFCSAITIDASHFLVAYSDYANPEYGKAVIGTITGSSITYGSEIAFNSGATFYVRAALLDATHFVVVYKNNSNSGYGQSRIGVISNGNEISFGTVNTYNSGEISHCYVSALDANHFVCVYKDDADSGYGNARIGTVTGSSISMGTEYCFNEASVSFVTCSALDASNFVVAFMDYSVYQAFSVIGTITNGDDISFGSTEIVTTSTIQDFSSTTLDANHFVLAYNHNGVSKGHAIVGTVSGNTISYGSEYVFDNTPAKYNSCTKLDEGRFLIAYMSLV